MCLVTLFILCGLPSTLIQFTLAYKHTDTSSFVFHFLFPQKTSTAQSVGPPSWQEKERERKHSFFHFGFTFLWENLIGSEVEAALTEEEDEDEIWDLGADKHS